MDTKARDSISRLYTVVMRNPHNDELAFSNFTSPIGILVTDANGRFIERIGREGRGPDEIQSARHFGFDDQNNVIVLDKTLALFKVFDRSDNSVRSYPMPTGHDISIVSRNLQKCDGHWYFAVQEIGRVPDAGSFTIGVFDNEFKLVDLFGGYDPFLHDKNDVLQETLISVDCENDSIYTTHAKIPYIQVYSIRDRKPIQSIQVRPKSFKISDRIIEFVTDTRAMFEFLTDEQSMSMHLFHASPYILLVYRNENFRPTDSIQHRGLNDREYHVAVFGDSDFEYLGEVRSEWAILGITNDGYLIAITDEENNTFELMKIEINPNQTSP